MHCKMNWKGNLKGAPFSINFIFCNPYSYYSRFFFHCFRCFFLAPISMLRFNAQFPTLLTPLNQFRFLYVFCEYFGALHLFLFVTTLSSFFYTFCRPMITFLFLIWPSNFKYLGALSCLVSLFIGSFSFNLFLLSLTGRHPCVFLFISYFLLISFLFSFSFA